MLRRSAYSKDFDQDSSIILRILYLIVGYKSNYRLELSPEPRTIQVEVPITSVIAGAVYG